MRVRRAEPEDARGILELHRRAVHEFGAEEYDAEVLDRWAPPVDTARVESFVESKFGEGEEATMFVAIDGERRLGFSEVEPDDEYLVAVYVDPELARSGLGRSLLRQAEWAAAQEGAERLQLESSLNAVEFYERQGYERIGEATHELSDGLEMDCVRMEKELPGPGF